MKVNVYSLEGQPVRQVDLPKSFAEPVRPDLIRRAVISEQTREYQPKGAYKHAGVETSADYKGRKEDYGSIKNRGISRLPREKLPKGRFGRVRIVPFSVKGRRAHPPKVEKILIEKINKKEYAKAMASAIAATTKKELVSKRGHVVEGVKEFPLIVDSGFEKVAKTKDILKVFSALGLDGDLERGKARKALSGVAKRRRGGTRTPRTVLVVVGEECGALKGARNLVGVDVAVATKLKASVLAPGTNPGRLTLWTEGAIKKLSG
ncbi:MAG: 50S ribosomal protein L4 [Candidatus Micrarchaeota archaeon]